MVIQPYYEKNDAHTSREALHPILAMRSNQYSNYCKEEGIEAKERTPSPNIAYKDRDSHFIAHAWAHC